MTKVINLFGGPGAGKSTNAAELFSLMKKMGINCELVPEFAKDLTWANRHEELENQVYVFGKQQHRMHRLMGKVDWIVTDAPYILSNVYTPSHYPNSFQQLVYDMWNKDDNRNFLLVRQKNYQEVGRNQTKEQAEEIDVAVKTMLDKWEIEYSIENGNTAAQDIFRLFKNNLLN